VNATIVTTDNWNVGTNWKEAAAAHFASALATTRIRDLDEKADTLNSSHPVGAAYPCWQLLGANTEPSASTAPAGPGPAGLRRWPERLVASRGPEDDVALARSGP
jgi:hypothetical protein